MSGHIIIIAVLLMLQPDEAPSTCVSPTPPDKLFVTAPSRPAVPSCVNERTNRHNCSARVIDAFNAQMEAYDEAFQTYVDEINGYIGRPNDYTSAVGDYTQCEQRRVAPRALITG